VRKYPFPEFSPNPTIEMIRQSKRKRLVIEVKVLDLLIADSLNLQKTELCLAAFLSGPGT
jgi:hypothetical protein